MIVDYFFFFLVPPFFFVPLGGAKGGKAFIVTSFPINKRSASERIDMLALIL